MFANQAAFDNTLTDLERQMSNYAVQTTESDECSTMEQPLASFANNLGHNSLRAKELSDECGYLDAGGDPKSYNGSWIIDNVLQTLLNQNNTLQIGTDIYWLKNEEVIYQILNADLVSYNDLLNGRQPTNERNVKKIVLGPESCNPQFTFTGFGSNTTSGTFTYSGTPAAGTGVTISWTFGDGTSSTQTNPSKTYSDEGTYNVCVTVKSTKDSCEQQFCQDVVVGSDCHALFTYDATTGKEGLVCFTNLSTIFGGAGNGTTWEWNFGNGQTSNLQNPPCITYPCNNTFWVTLTMTTPGGCTSFWTLPVFVNSYGTGNCCGKKSRAGKADYLYAGGQKKIEYEQEQYNLPFYRKVVAEMTNFRRDGNKWKKERADLKIRLEGVVYTPEGNGCKCQNQINITGESLGLNKKHWVHKFNVGAPYKARKLEPWKTKYTVNNSLIATINSQTTCDN